MKICVIGLGSIGKRHIKNIRSLYKNADIDVLRHSDHAGSESDGYRTITSINDLDAKYDAVFITNPTTMHMDTLRSVIERSRAFFIEKPLRPLGTEPAELDDLPKDKEYYVACPLRYTGIVQYIKANFDWNNVYSLRAISSSYLPEWRPGTDYRKCYSARKDLGGGVAADLIHEWDYISYLIGKPERIHVVERKLSNLELDVEDIALYIGEYSDKLVEVHLDYFGREMLRELQIFMRDDTVICDFIESRIKFMKTGEILEFNESRDGYQISELRHFFDIVEGKAENDSTIYEAERLLRLLENKRTV